MAETMTLGNVTTQACYAQSKDGNQMSFAENVLYFLFLLEHALAVPQGI